MNQRFRSAMRFIILMGFVSLFSDIVYEGARGVAGPFLLQLGASAAVVAFTAGFGELAGYVLRLFSGYLADRTKRPWLFTLLGYSFNLFSIPLLAFVWDWRIAMLLMILERTGKAIRKPARDSMVSYAAKQVGPGFGFGIEEALDQIGAVSGPLILSLILSFKSGELLERYHFGFSILWIPASISMILLIVGRFLFPRPIEFEKELTGKSRQSSRLGFEAVLYLVAAGLLAAGFVDFPLMSYHMAKHELFVSAVVPLLYSIAMGVDAASAIFFGRLYDRLGITALIASTALGSLAAPLVFLAKGRLWIVLGVSLWGISMGAQESVMKAVIAKIIPPEKRGFAYGLLNSVFGVSWFAGSFAMGLLYQSSLGLMVSLSLLLQLGSVAVMYVLKSRAAV
ncbi:MFS transporter [Thermotoga sp. Ku-13t]|uniref:MFS transporter n=1 Tax=Thermotoga sp. Ku-13t TaxID=1755813 RepID=UPI0013EC364C|nr:MFS transporter [Thermotoga sp. Ku-13t]KAF2958247.1 MFS transporter [Thermotoga sp. Ku-13t]